MLLTHQAPCHADTQNCGRKILGALSAGLVDSAFAYLGEAVKHGLPDDSLYYFWAEIYIARGSLDTALALSIAGQRADSGALTQTLRTQRYNIYLSLGLRRDADDLLDTILGSMPPVRRSIPRLTLNSWLGGNWRNSIERQPYPFITETPVAEPLLNPGGDFSPSLVWFLPLKNGIIFVPGINYSFTNGVEREEFAWDTLNHALGASFDVKNIWRRFSAGDAIQVRLGMFGGWSAVNTATLSRSKISSSGLSYSSLIYSLEVDENKDISYQALWLMHYLTRTLTSRITLQISPLATCYFTDDIISKDAYSVMYIDDPKADTVSHFTDRSCTQIIPIPEPLTSFSQIPLLRAYRAASDPRTFSIIAPESYCGITPSMGLTCALPRSFSIEGAVKGMVNYYFKEHEWISLSQPYSMFTFEESSWLAYSKSDGKYYLVEELGKVPDAEKYSGPLEFHKKRRLDFMIGGEVSLERSLGKHGAIGINGYVKKYHSTLQNDLPVKMKDLFYGAGVFCRIYAGAEQPLSAL
jgi:hypothetical protein